MGRGKDSARVLLVEGDDDKHTVLSLLAKHNVPEVFAVKQTGGVAPLLESLEVLLRVSLAGNPQAFARGGRCHYSGAA